MLIHPLCPCSRASIEELDRLMAQSRDLVTARVLFVKPAGVAENWEQSDTWRRAATIPGVQVVRDDGGIEAERFGAVTSGQVVLYAAAGHLLFSGGITASRGHAGDNQGRSAIASLLSSGHADKSSSAVFGCPLQGPDPDRVESMEKYAP